MKLALGTAAVDCAATVVEAIGSGVTTIDTSPWYGLGAAEDRLGEALAETGTAGLTLSTKVGYVLGGVPGRQDFSGPAVRASLEASLRRLGVPRVDTVLIHDPDAHEREALDEAYPALHELRAAGTIRRIGVGMNQTAMLSRFVRDTDLDVVLIAGRYTLLDPGAGRELLPLCRRRGVEVMVGGVFNSGILAGGSSYDYRAAPEDLRARTRRLARICASYGVPLAAAALQFPARHPAVGAVLMGPGNRAELAADLAHWRREIPDDLWAELATLA